VVGDAGLRIRASLEERHTKIAVIDDDPTGTQTVRDVPVLTGWRDEDLAWALARPEPLVVVNVNTRSLSEADARTINEDLGERFTRRAAAQGIDIRFLSRSDSTLRGHFPAETDALRTGIARAGGSVDGVILCPAFLDAGRLTIDDVHYVRDQGRLIPVAATEYARDRAFGYADSDLRDWAVSRGVARSLLRSLGLDAMRAHGPAYVASRLLSAPEGAVVVANAADPADLDVLVLGIVEAEAAGARFLYRTGPSFVGARAGQGRPVALTDDEIPDRPGSGLLVVGSHTRLTTRQLARAGARHRLGTVELSVPEIAAGRGRQEIRRAGADHADARGHGNAALVTSRRFTDAGGAEASLELGRRVADALVETVAGLDPAIPLAWVVAKGGITSSEMATRAFGASRATVAGQLFPGLVSLWVLGEGSRRPHVPFVVFPGNVGDDEALADTLDRLTGTG
jgi:uncharacterized protein YgbK (DUF1537 family)